jgi:hypothetical protein
MTGIILPPSLPVEVEREIALAVLAATPGDRERFVREVVKRHAEIVHRAWEGSVGLAMRSLRGTGAWTYLDRIKVWALIDLSFGTVPPAILDAIYQARAKWEARKAERNQQEKNFDSAISRREAGDLLRDRGRSPGWSRVSFGSAKAGGYW